MNIDLTPWIPSLSEAMALLEGLRSGKRNAAEAYAVAVSAYERVEEALNQIQELAAAHSRTLEEVRRLEGLLRFSESVERRGECLVSEGGHKYCLHCWERDRRELSLFWHGHGRLICHACRLRVDDPDVDVAPTDW